MASKRKRPKDARKWCARCEEFVRPTTTAPNGHCALCGADLEDMEEVEYEWPLV